MPKIKFMLVDDQQLVRAGIRRILPQVKVIALTAMDGEPFRLHDAGAAGYLTKGCPASGMRISPKTVSTYRQRIFSTSWRSRTRWN